MWDKFARRGLDIFMKFAHVLCGVVATLTFGNTEALVKPMEHDIITITPQNFDGAIRKNRDVGVSAILFYKKNNEAKTMINGWYNEVAKDLKGMVKIGAVNCDEFPVLCKEHNNKGTFPTIMTYPPLPIPAGAYEGKLEKGPLSGFLTRMIPNNNVKQMTSANIDEFLSTRPEIPKVILFSKKDKSPTLFSALSNAFYKEMNFGFVGSNEEALAKRFHVTKFPHILLIKSGNQRKPERYNGQISYEAVHTWINLFRETFVSGGGFSGEPDGVAASANEPAPKPWLSDPMPEMYKASADNLCFKKDDKSLCVIYLSKGPLSASLKSSLIGLKDRFVSGLDDRGVSFKWMWMNADEEPEFNHLFNAEVLPSVIVFNPNKRLRFMRAGNTEPITTDSISALLDKIAGGDGRFLNVPGQKLPSWSKRDNLGVPIVSEKKANSRDEL